MVHFKARLPTTIILFGQIFWHNSVDLIAVLEAILNGTQTCLEITVFNGNQMSNNFHKTSLLKNRKLLALGKDLKKIEGM